MSWRERLKRRVERGKERYQAGRAARAERGRIKSEEEYRRDLKRLRELSEQERRLGVKVRIRRKEERVRGLRRETSLIGRLFGEEPQRPPRATRKKRKKRKPKKRKRRQAKPREKPQRRDPFGVPY